MAIDHDLDVMNEVEFIHRRSETLAFSNTSATGYYVHQPELRIQTLKYQRINNVTLPIGYVRVDDLHIRSV
jgi:hypothetical protein